jgi:hypothetical protein
MSHKKYRTETNCLNCGAEVKGKFCSECGQENLEVKENIFHIVGHFVSDYFHFDSKFFRSVVPLFTKPGFLTKEYWDGRRVSYIHPLRLFFFITIIFVIASSYFYSHYEKLIKSSAFSFTADSALLKFDDAYLAKLNDTVKVFVGKDHDSVTVKEIRREKADAKGVPSKVWEGTNHVIKNLKYVTFFLLPVYGFLFKLLYIRRKSFYVDHLVYMMHVQSFIYTVLSIIFLLTLLLPVPLDMVRRISVLILFIYLVISLRYLYHQAWWKTVLKSLIATFALVVITFFSIGGLAAIDGLLFQK